MRLLEEFLAHLDVFAEAPEGIERLRGMLLDLAIRGRLVPRSASDEPAFLLLERIAQERKRLRWPAPRAYDKGEPAPPPFELPSTWNWTCLAQLGVVAPRNEAADEAEVAFVPMPAIPTDYRQPVAPTPRPWGEIKKGYTHFANGDVALAKITPCFQNRKSCVMEGLPGGMGAGTTELHVLRPIPGLVNTRYLLLFLKSPYFIEGGIPRMTGTAGQQRVPVDYFASTPVPLPPLGEQQRIVDRLDQLMALCDELEAKQSRKQEVENQLTRSALVALTDVEDVEAFDEVWARLSDHFEVLFDAPERVDVLRQTLLELAILGKLVSQSEDDEPVTVQLAKIEKERAATRRASAKERKPAEMEASQFKLPPGWSQVRWGMLIHSTESGWSPKAENRPRTGEEWGVLKVSAVSWGRFDPDENKVLPTTDVPDEGYVVREGDFLMSRANTSELVGRSVIVQEKPYHLIMSDKIVRCHFSQHVDRMFINYFNRTLMARAHYVKHSSGTSDSMKNISRDVILDMPMPLPPLAEQRRIAARLGRLLAQCDVLEDQLRKWQERAQQLGGALIAEMVA